MIIRNFPGAFLLLISCFVSPFEAYAMATRVLCKVVPSELFVVV